MDMENRIAVLERDVTAIKSELAVIRLDHVSAKELNDRIQGQLTSDVAQLKEDVVSIRIELTRIGSVLGTLQAECATKADLTELHAKLNEVAGNMKGWMLGIALTVMSLNFGMNVVFYNAQKITSIAKPAQEQPIVPQAIPAPATIK